MPRPSPKQFGRRFTDATASRDRNHLRRISETAFGQSPALCTLRSEVSPSPKSHTRTPTLVMAGNLQTLYRVLRLLAKPAFKPAKGCVSSSGFYLPTTPPAITGA